MAYREIGMWEVLDVLRRIHRGEKHRAIARVTGHSRTTVGRYEATARGLGWLPVLVEPDEGLATAVIQELRPDLDRRYPYQELSSCLGVRSANSRMSYA